VPAVRPCLLYSHLCRAHADPRPPPAVANGVSPSPRVGAAAHAHVRCRLTTRSTSDDPTSPDSGGGTPCSFLISASNRPFGTGLAPVTVTYAEFEHSCSPRARRADFAEYKDELEARIERMAEVLEREEDEVRRREAECAALTEEDERAAQGAERRARAAKREGEQRRRASGAGSRKRESAASIDLTGEESESEDDDEGEDEPETVRALFPAAADVQPLIDRLIEVRPFSRCSSLLATRSDLLAPRPQNGTVDFPDFTDTFASASALLALLYAYAQQRHFSLYRRSDASSSSRIRLRCWRSHHRYAAQPGGCCPVSIIATLVDDVDRWSVDEAVLEHNHQLSYELRPLTGPERARERAQERAHKRARRATASSSPPLVQQPRASTSAWSAAHEPPRLAAAVEPHYLDRPERHSSPPCDPPPPLCDDVALFLAGTLAHVDSAIVDSVASALTHELGMSSVDNVVDFLSLERNSVDAMEDELRLRKGYEDCSWSLRDLHEVLSEAFESGEP